MQITEFNIANDELSKYNDAGLITLTGIISNEPDIRDAYQKIKVKIDDSTILVTTNRYPEYKYLDTIKLTGKLETPSETEEFSYKNYLMKDGIYSVMGFPKMEVISQEHKHNILTYLYEKILFCKQKIRESIQKNFLPPQSLIMEGTILGNNGAMTQDLKNKLNITGLRHIIAVSGTHVVILSAIIMNVLLGMGLWRGQAFYVSIIFICIYIVLTGLPPSGVRAGIMGGTYLLSQKIGRQTMGYRLIMLACAIMLLINPMLLFYDVGFQLSFLAVVGLIYLEPIIKRFIKIFTKQKVENFVGIVSTTFAAQIFTLPIMIYNFGNISFVSPITNLLILPSVYGLMVFGFLASILGVFSSVLGWILSIPCWILLNYFVWIMDFFSQPWMAKNIENVSWVWLFILYFIIVVGTTFLNKKYKQSLV
jgi:competence protein ComEC